MAYDWNIDWETVPGDDLLNKKVIDLFAEAVFERAQLYFAADLLTEIGSDNYYLQETYTLLDVVQFRRELASLQFNPQWLDTSADPSGAEAMPMLLQRLSDYRYRVSTVYNGTPFQVRTYYWGPETVEDRPFPEAGTTRKVPREIFDLSQPGVNGEVARFTACINRTWRSALSADPLFGTVANTPVDQRQLSRGKYKRQGGAWVSVEETTSPDVLTEIYPGQPRFPFSNFLGDYFGGHWLNDTRDMLNQLTAVALGTSRVRRWSGGDNYETGIDGFAVVRLNGGDAIQIDIVNPDARNWMLEFWINWLSDDPAVVESPGNFYRHYTTWEKLGEMLISSSGRFTHPLPAGRDLQQISVTNVPSDNSTLISPLVIVVIRGDVDGGLKYQA